MKIAYIHTGLFPSNSPSITFTTGTALGLAENFNHCYFFIKRNSTLSADEILKKNFNLTQPKNLEIIQIKFKFNTNYFYFKKVYKILKKLIKENKLDAIITRSITFLPYLAKMKIRFAIPAYFESHDFYSDLSVRTDINQNKKYRYSKLERKYLAEISGIIYLQHSQKQWYEKLFPDQKIYVARTGIDKIIHKPFSNRNLIAYVGARDRPKRVDGLIKSLALSKSQPQLLIIGSKNENEKNELLTFVEKEYDASLVEITGWVNKQKLHKYLEQTMIGIIPLQDTFFQLRLLQS